MESAEPVQRFNSPRGWRLVGFTFVWATAFVWYGWLTSSAEPDLQTRLLWTVPSAAIVGLPMLGIWLVLAKEITVGPSWLESRSWFGALLHQGPGQRWLAERGHAVVRQVGGQVTVEPAGGSIGHPGLGYSYKLGWFRRGQWIRLSKAVRGAGFEVDDRRSAWELAHPMLHREHQLLSGGIWLAWGVVILSFLSPAFWARSQPPSVASWLFFGGVAVALVLGILAWSLPRVGREPEPSGELK